MCLPSRQSVVATSCETSFCFVVTNSETGGISMMQYATPVKNLIFLARLELLLCHVRQRMWPRLFSVQNKTCSYFRVKLEPEIINCQNLKCCRVLYSYHLSSLMGNPTSSHGIPIRYTVGKGRTSSGNPGQKHNIGGGPFKPVRDPDIYI